ncbi:MAG: type II toxin-antitoxin system VapC family toxin [Candidatus Dormibacteraceae bacterium]
MSSTEVVNDASVALKWFHVAGEEALESARRLLTAYRARQVALYVLDLTYYEIGNALLRGKAAAGNEAVTEVLTSLRTLCLTLVPTHQELGSAALLAERHRLTMYDAAYAAVANTRGMSLATFDRRLLEARLGEPPDAILSRLH